MIGRLYAGASRKGFAETSADNSVEIQSSASVCGAKAKSVQQYRGPSSLFSAYDSLLKDTVRFIPSARQSSSHLPSNPPGELESQQRYLGEFLQKKVVSSFIQSLSSLVEDHRGHDVAGASGATSSLIKEKTRNEQGPLTVLSSAEDYSSSEEPEALTCQAERESLFEDAVDGLPDSPTQSTQALNKEPESEADTVVSMLNGVIPEKIPKMNLNSAAANDDHQSRTGSSQPSLEDIKWALASHLSFQHIAGSPSHFHPLAKLLHGRKDSRETDSPTVKKSDGGNNAFCGSVAAAGTEQDSEGGKSGLLSALKDIGKETEANPFLNYLSVILGAVHKGPVSEHKLLLGETKSKNVGDGLSGAVGAIIDNHIAVPLADGLSLSQLMERAQQKKESSVEVDEGNLAVDDDSLVYLDEMEVQYFSPGFNQLNTPTPTSGWFAGKSSPFASTPGSSYGTPQSVHEDGYMTGNDDVESQAEEEEAPFVCESDREESMAETTVTQTGPGDGIELKRLMDETLPRRKRLNSMHRRLPSTARGIVNEFVKKFSRGVWDELITEDAVDSVEDRLDKVVVMYETVQNLPVNARQIVQQRVNTLLETPLPVADKMLKKYLSQLGLWGGGSQTPITSPRGLAISPRAKVSSRRGSLADPGEKVDETYLATVGQGRVLEYREGPCLLPQLLLQRMRCMMHYVIATNAFLVKVQYHADDSRWETHRPGMITPESVPPTPNMRQWYAKRVDQYTTVVLSQAAKKLELLITIQQQRRMAYAETEGKELLSVDRGSKQTAIVV